MVELEMRERIILAIDTSTKESADRLINIAREAGARFVKLGLELFCATDWQYCSDVAARHGLDWVADAKLYDIPNTIAGAIKSLRKLEHPPFGITMHTTAGKEAMRVAQEEAGDIKMLGVTILTSVSDEDCRSMYGVSVRQKVMDLSELAAEVGLSGVVASPQEVRMIKENPITSNLFAMIPGTRSQNADAHDQARTSTPSAAIRDGADLLVIGRQITKAENPAVAFEMLVRELESAA